MKKTLTLLLALALSLGLTAVTAQELDLGEPGPAGVSARPEAQLRDDILSQRSGADFPTPKDTVTIDGNVFSITSPTGATVSFQAPFGLLVFSQDIVQQLFDYAMTKDPLSIVTTLIDNDLSLLVVDPSNGDQIMVFFAADNLSAMIPGMEDEALVDKLAEHYGGEAHTLGGQVYLRTVEDGTLVYFTFHAGVRVGFQMVTVGEEPTAAEEEMMRGLVELTSFP